MIKKALSILIIVVTLFTFSGCTYRTNYIKKYNDELQLLFGDFEYNYLGKEHDRGIDGLGAHWYKQWQINYTDSNGMKENAIIRNDKDFDQQIVEIYKEKIKKNVTNNFSEYCDFQNDNWYSNCNTRKYDYRALIFYEFELDNYYSDDYEIEDYNFFDFTNIDIYKLIENKIIYIKELKYIPNSKIVLNKNELETELNYLKDITNKIRNIISIENVYYRKNEYAVNYKGETYISINDYELY